MELSQIPMSDLEKHIDQLKQSDFVIMIYSESVDLKLALECGYSVLLGKQIILMVEKNLDIPPLLRRLPNIVSFIRYDREELSDGIPQNDLRDRLAKVCKRMLAEAN